MMKRGLNHDTRRLSDDLAAHINWLIVNGRASVDDKNLLDSLLPHLEADECDFCAGSPIPGVLFPTGFDDREECRDGKVWVARHDECAKFGSDVEAAEALSKATGWPVMKSYDRDDDISAQSRNEKIGTDFYRPYFDVTLEQAEKWEYEVRARRRK